MDVSFNRTEKMKNYVLPLLLVISMSCVQFPSRYDRIETDKIRAIGFTYSPFAEGSPGDTIQVKCYLAGDTTVRSLSWSMSYDAVINAATGADTVINRFDLPVFNVSSHLPDSVEMSFVVPDSAFFLTRAIPDKALEGLKKQLPASMQGMTQKDFAALLIDLGAVDYTKPLSIAAFFARWGSVLGATSMADTSSIMAVAFKACAVFSIPAVLYADVVSGDNKKLRIKGEFSIRYNRRFQNIPGMDQILPVNNNPKIRWIGMYKARSKDFNPFKQWSPKTSDSLYYLYNELFPDSIRNTVLIDTGFVYFLATDSGMINVRIDTKTPFVGSFGPTGPHWDTLDHDTTICDTSLDKFYYKDNTTGKDTFQLETFYYDWMYQNLDLDSVTMKQDSLFTIMSGGTNGGGGQSCLNMVLPSIDVKMTHARIWVTVYDFVYGTYNRPSAFAIRQADIYFKYSDAYIQKKK